MSASHPRFTDEGKGIFNEIYDAAKRLDKAELEKLHDKYLTFNVWLGFYSPITKLAAEGLQEAVFLLIKLGANPNDAAEGAAMGAQFDLLNILQSNHDITVDKIMFGVAFAREYQYAKKLFYVEGASMESMVCGIIANGDLVFAEKLREEYSIDVRTCIQTAAVAGHVEYAKILCDKYKINYSDAVIFARIGGHHFDLLANDYQASQQSLAVGAAFSFNAQDAERLRIQYSLDPEQLILKAIACGDLCYAEKLRVLLPSKFDFDRLITEVVASGHVKYAEYLREMLRVSTIGAGMGAVRANLIGYIHSLREEDSICGKGMVSAAAYVGNWRLLQRFYNKYNEDLSSSADFASKGGHFNSSLQALHVLSFIDFEHVRNILVGVGAKNILLSIFSDVKSNLMFYLKSGQVKPVNLNYSRALSENYVHLLPKAKRINQRMRNSKFTYNQASAWDDIGIRIWFLQGISLVQLQKLPAELFVHISSFVLPPPAGINEVEELMQLAFLTNKKNLGHSIRQFANKNSFFSQVEAVQNKWELRGLLRDEIIKQNEKSYEEVLCRYYKRLGL